MAKTISATVALSIQADLVDALDLASATFPLRYSPAYPFADGTGTNQAKNVFTDTRTLVASASENLDLSGTALNDPMGSALAFTKIKALMIRAAPGNTNDVLVGGHATAALATMFGDATDKVRVTPGGAVMFVSPTGYDVTATTADLLTVANSAGGTSVTYDVIVLGTT